MKTSGFFITTNLSKLNSLQQVTAKQTLHKGYKVTAPRTNYIASTKLYTRFLVKESEDLPLFVTCPEPPATKKAITEFKIISSP